MLLFALTLIVSTPPLRAQGQKLGFVEVPQNISAAVGESLLLKCIANSVIKDCQWSWQSLEDGPNGTVTLVKEYPAFGDEVTNDCSVRFFSLLPEQEGYWICGIRGPEVTSFINSPPAKLVVQRTIVFSEVTKDTVLEVGQELLLTCKTAEQVKQCQWTWRGLTSNTESELTVKIFPAFGNESQDCSIRLSSVLIEQEGFWTCGARNSESNFTTARPMKLSVRYPHKGELRFKYCDYRVTRF